jgi:hypothetical protein
MAQKTAKQIRKRPTATPKMLNRKVRRPAKRHPEAVIHQNILADEQMSGF